MSTTYRFILHTKIGKLAIGEPFRVTQSSLGAWQLLFTI